MKVIFRQSPLRPLLAGLFCSLMFLAPAQSALPDTQPLDIPQKIDIQYSWMGFATSFPVESFTLIYQTDGQFKATGKHEETTRSDRYRPKNWKVDTLIPQPPVAELFKRIDNASWKPTAKPLSVIEHTDDYPHFTVLFKLPDQQPAKLFSTSNTKTGAPWNLVIGNRLFASHDPELGPAVDKLLTLLRESKKAS